MPETTPRPTTPPAADLGAGLVVFLVALPLCLGIALASAPTMAGFNPKDLLFPGLLAGIVGGVVVGLLSGSHTSVAGPAAGLTAVVAAQIALLGSFEAFLLALFIAGLIQIGLGLARAGFIAAFFPSSVIKGLLAAIGVILILKQIPHLFGHDTDPEGEMAFQQPDHENTLTELLQVFADLHPGAAAIGLASLAILIFWEWYKPLKKSLVPAPLVVVLFGVAVTLAFQRLGGVWVVEASHLVQVPVLENPADVTTLFRFPDFSKWAEPAVYLAGLTIAAVASLETLLNLQAADKLDPQQRTSPPSRELLAQGVGNTLCGLVGGLPVTSVIVRTSVNINAGGKTKLSAIFHGVLLLVCVVFFARYVNLIPLASLAAILLVTGVKLVSPALVKQMWEEGPYQFVPFAVTLLAIVFTDLLVGILIGLGVTIAFILNSNVRRPLRRFQEKHVGGEVLHIELANQVSFLNRATLEKALREVPRGGHVLIDASHTDYIDPDILDLIRDFQQTTAPAHDVQVSLLGFRAKYNLDDKIQFVDYSSREVQEGISPDAALQILLDGNERFRSGNRLSRDLGRQRGATAKGQHPIAVVLSCIDSRTPAEIIFDLGLGDIFSVRVAGNITSRKILASMEYGCAVAGAKLVLVLGHTNCGAVGAAVQGTCVPGSLGQAADDCEHLGHILQEIALSVDATTCSDLAHADGPARDAIVNAVARRNVLRVCQQIQAQSTALRALVRQGKIAIVGALYDLATGDIEILSDVPASYGYSPRPMQ